MVWLESLEPARGVRRGARCSYLALVVILAVEPTAFAEERDPVAAEALFRQGLAALRAEDWGSGCEKFQKSMALDPAVSTEFKIAKCYEHDNQLAKAWYAYELAQKMNRESQASEKRRSDLDRAIVEALAALKPQVPTLRVTVTPNAPDLEVMRDGVAIPVAILGEVIPVDPGTHEILVRASGFEERRQTVEVPIGRAIEANIQLVSLKSPTQAPPSAPPATPAPATHPAGESIQTKEPAATPMAERAPPTEWSQRHTGIAVAATGVVALGVAGYFELRTQHFIGEMAQYKTGDSYSSGVQSPHADALKNQNLALIFAGAGAALTGIGLGLYFTEKPRVAKSSATSTCPFELLVTPTALGARGVF